MKILIASPVRQRPAILRAFLLGLEEADKGGCGVDYYFADDNTDPESSRLLEDFAARHGAILRRGEELLREAAPSAYACGEDTHVWDNSAIEKITRFKDTMIRHCVEAGYDYLFLVDSDIVIDKRTIPQLLKRQVEIVSAVFWTQWTPNAGLSPQCFWMPELRDRIRTPFGRQISAAEAEQYIRDFQTKLMIPGLYRVDGLGACTLIARSALEKGVRFQRIDNLQLQGEDRFFCVRAGVCGIPLYLDTSYPCYHIYREEYLDRVEEFKREGFKFDMCQSFVKSPRPASAPLPVRLAKKLIHGIAWRLRAAKRKKQTRALTLSYDRSRVNNRIVLQMPVHNECGRYLEDVLRAAADAVDFYVIIDDASTDGTAELCERLLRDKPHVIVKNPESLFHTEYLLRGKLWQEVEKHDPGWILSLDADDVLPDYAPAVIRRLVQSPSVDCFCFPKCDMWNENEYRDDALWCAHKNYYPFLMRYAPGHEYHWRQTNQHCGSYPLEQSMVARANIDLYIKHYGWARQEDREAKYRRYLQLDPGGKIGSMEQYGSILDEAPVLRRYDELPKLG